MTNTNVAVLPSLTVEAAEALAAIQADVHEAVRQLQLGRAISYARSGSVTLRLPGGRIVTSALTSAVSASARGVAVIESGADLRKVLLPFPTEALLIHRATLEARSNAKASLIFRGRHLAGWAVAQRPIPVRYFQMFNYTQAKEIPVATLAHAGDVKTVTRVLEDNPDAPELLLSTGDTVIWSRNILPAARLALALEEAAQVTAIAERLGGAKPYPPGIGETIYAALAAHS